LPTPRPVEGFKISAEVEAKKIGASGRQNKRERWRGWNVVVRNYTVDPKASCRDRMTDGFDTSTGITMAGG